MFYTLNLHSAICQLYLSKTGKKGKKEEREKKEGRKKERMNCGDPEVLGLRNLGLWLSAGTPGDAAADGEKSPGLVQALPPPGLVTLDTPLSLSLRLDNSKTHCVMRLWASW